MATGAATGGTVTDAALARALRALVTASLGIVLQGATCAPYQNVSVHSTPAAAQVFVDGDFIGVTPQRLAIGTLSDHKVFLKKDGYRPELVVLTLHRPTDGINFLTPPDVYVTLSPLDGSERDSDVEVQLEQGAAAP